MYGRTSERLIGANLLAVFGVPVEKDVWMLSDTPGPGHLWNHYVRGWPSSVKIATKNLSKLIHMPRPNVRPLSFFSFCPSIQAKASGKKLQKVTLKVSPRGIILYDSASNQLIENISIYR